ncbi:hypothetical protein EES47_29835 [Streptomyces sp. ADI98-12]|nr:hypothetical protein EES47_29835 [Streptomyces sp. ADI98-12]
MLGREVRTLPAADQHHLRVPLHDQLAGQGQADTAAATDDQVAAALAQQLGAVRGGGLAQHLPVRGRPGVGDPGSAPRRGRQVRGQVGRVEVDDGDGPPAVFVLQDPGEAVDPGRVRVGEPPSGRGGRPCGDHDPVDLGQPGPAAGVRGQRPDPGRFPAGDPRGFGSGRERRAGEQVDHPRVRGHRAADLDELRAGMPGGQFGGQSRPFRCVEHHDRAVRRHRLGGGTGLPPRNVGAQRHRLRVRRRRAGRISGALAGGAGSVSARPGPAAHPLERVAGQGDLAGPPLAVQHAPVRGGALHPGRGQRVRVGRRGRVDRLRGTSPVDARLVTVQEAPQRRAESLDVGGHHGQPLGHRVAPDLRGVGDVRQRDAAAQCRGQGGQARLGVHPGRLSFASGGHGLHQPAQIVRVQAQLLEGGVPVGAGEPGRVGQVRQLVPGGQLGVALGEQAQGPRGARGQQHHLRAVSGARCRCRVLLDDEVGVAAPGAERADAGAPGHVAGGVPRADVLLDAERGVLPVDRLVRRSRVQRGHQGAVPQLQQHLGQPGDAGRGLQVPDARLHRAELSAAGSEDLAERGDLHRITEGGAGAVRLQVAHRGRVHAGAVQRLPDHVRLRRRVRDVEAAGAPAVVDRAAFDHREHAVAVRHGGCQGFEDDDTDALTGNVPVAAGAEGPAPPVRRDEPDLAQVQIFVRVDDQVHAAGQRQFALSGAQALAGQVQRCQRRRAHGVQREAGTARVEEVGDPVRDRRGERRRQHRQPVLGAEAEHLVLGEHDAGEHAHGPAGDRGAGDAGILQRVPRGLEE